NSSMVDLGFRFGEVFFSGGQTFLRAPGETLVSGSASVPNQFNQFHALVGYGHPDKKGFSWAVSGSVDANRDFVQFGAVQGTYNWDCCGITGEYRRFDLGPLRSENQVRFSFTLINIGAFGTLARNERLF